ncbi:hypothetical protein [Synechococcus phage DSL-LC03]|nr:hypothetical protein [Synechococcus phage DSL-LC03]
MPQNTNLNVSPYYDDFNEDKNYKRVLFKPGTPIQSRELTTLQSILQNQIDRFGQHFFKEGAKVIPGQTSYDNRIDFVRLESIYFGINVNNYVKNLVGLTILGQTSGLQAKIELAITKEESTVNSDTLYFRYGNSSPNDFETQKFIPGETLLVASDLNYGDGQVIPANSPFANVIPEDATGKASIAGINEGIYFLRGHFVKVLPATIILDQYSIDANARVGLLIEEDIITSYDDETLNDNAQGFSNYSAPGADRLKIAATFIKKDLDDFNDENFVELMRIVNGDLQTFKPSKANDDSLRETLARRTFDESGNYIVKPFEVFVKENLNDGLGNNGVYYDFQTTLSGLTPSESALTLEISPGKGYIEGYDIEKISTTLIDIDKPRTSRAVDNFAINFVTSAQVGINNVYGNPRVGITTTDVIQLSDSRVDNSSPSTLPGNQIGVARLYDFYAPDSKYTGDNTRFEALIYDIETYTTVSIASSITLNAPAKIEGNSSGASGYLKSNVSNSKNLTLYSAKGKFLIGESISVNGISSSPTITSVRDYDFSDVKSIRSVDAGTSQVFTADLILENVKNIAPSATQFTITTGGTVTVGVTTVSTILPKVGDIVTYTKQGNPYPTYNKVTAVSSNLKSFTVTGITSVGVGATALIDGSLPASEITTNDLTIVQPNLTNNEDKDMFEPLPAPNISSLDLTNSQLQIRKTYIGNVASNSITFVESDPNLFFKPFNVNEYQLSYTDGQIEPLQSGSVSITNGGKSLTITQLSKASSSNAKLIATLDKINVTTKKKNLVRCATLTINRSSLSSSGTGDNTLNDGLTYSTIYGTRVQDKEICLNVADVLVIQDIFESYDTNDPILPSMNVVDVVGDLTTVLPGQVINGLSSKAQAKVVSTTSSTITFTYVNSGAFSVGETLDFINSDTSAVISTLNQFSKDISDKYSLDTGVRQEFVDYGRIVLSPGQQPPSKKITIVYDYYTTPSGDSGDFTSFSSFDPSLYRTSIPEVYGDLRATDAIDIRPRVSDYDPATATLSPFEWSSRDFSASGASVKNPILSNSLISLGYSYYLGRIDVVYLNRNGTFEIVAGAPSESPLKPTASTTALDIAVVSMPPYVYSAKEVKVSQITHRRYTMKDIERLEQRIANVEKVTSLSFLESNTKNLSIKDAKTGLDRFKSGFFVDSFLNHDSHVIANPDFKASIDTENGILRPSHYTTSLDLSYTSDVTTDGVNIKKTGKIVTLDYTEEVEIEQNFATRLENVNPFSIVNWSGTLKISPESDTWIDTKKMDSLNLEQNGLYDAMNASLGIDPNTGYSEVDWGAWEKTWSGKEITDSRLVSKDGETLSVPYAYQVTEKNKKGKNVKKNKPVTDKAAKEKGKPLFKKVKVWEEEWELETTTTDKFEKKGVQFKVTEGESEVLNLGTRLVSRELIPYMRARNIEFTAKRLKPNTQFYPFFGKVNVSDYCFPKLIEIEMVSGTFQAGENVIGGSTSDETTGKVISFKLQASDHKYDNADGTYEAYGKNPYSAQINVPSSYSSTSTILNVDTDSLQEMKDGGYYGYIYKGMKLTGKTSSAVAKVKDVRLISDSSGTLIGSFYVPNSAINNNPAFTSGTKTFLLTSDADNDFIPGEIVSAVEANFTASGELQVSQDTTISTRIPKIEKITTTDTKVETSKQLEVKEYTKTQAKNANYIKVGKGKNQQIIPLNAGEYDETIAKVLAEDEEFATSQSSKKAKIKELQKEAKVKGANKKAIKNEINSTKKALASEKKKYNAPKKCGYKDPIAQTFKVDSETGYFVTSIEVYFQKKDATLPISCQIRSVVAGSPTSVILPLAEVTLEPSQVSISEDASVATKFTFESPIYLKDQTEYAIVLQTDSSDYFAWISRMGEVDISTKNQPESQQIVVSQQPYLGSLFKSQNGETWDASQLEDLKFKVYTAVFNEDGGTFATYSPLLGKANKQIVNLKKDPIQTLSRDAIIGLGASITTPATSGVTITQLNNLNATGKLIATYGAIGIGSTLALTVNNVGSALTPASGSYTFTGVPLVSLTGIGTGAIAQVEVVNGTIGLTTVTSGGRGYAVGDVVTAKLGQLSENVRFNVGIISAFNSLRVTNVQGEFDTTNELIYLNVGAATTFNYAGSAPIPTSILTTPEDDGMHFKVSHRNHGMHSKSNKVIISGIKSNLPPVTLSSDYAVASTSSLPISSVGIFTSFENVSVSSTNPGYVLIDDEIIGYTGTDDSVSPAVLTGITRGIDSSSISLHETNDAVYKYELNGVSLRRINTTHSMADANPLLVGGIDEYYLKINTTPTGNGVVRDGTVANGFPILRFNDTSNVGDQFAYATQNIQFEALTPNIGYQTPPATAVDCRIRTVSGTSASGNEVSFVDQGFQQITLNQINYFDTPRIIASEVNETSFLTTLPKNKSFWCELVLTTDNEKVSPIIDLERLAMITTTNRIDAPVTDFINDRRVNQSTGDPHAAVYVSKKVVLENPATSLDVRFGASRPESNDIRVMYKLFRPDIPDAGQPYEFFPGYAGEDDGTSDKVIASDSVEGTYSDYKFTADNLPPFTGFIIKIIMSGTNQAKPPLISDLSVIALA